MPGSKPPRVLLFWPGTEGPARGNFGCPQLVLMATYASQHTKAVIHIRDAVGEQALGTTSYASIFEGPDGKGYDIIAFSVYSSYDHLKCFALAEQLRSRWPEAVIVAGGYHPSARPMDYVFEESPFDLCVIGEGEKPLVRIIESVDGGSPLRAQILPSDPISCLSELPPSDWSFLERYRKVARRMASQAQVYLSRGCPFDCAFCMERAKRETSWRSLGVEQAVHEVTSLHRFLNLEGWTLYIADALFGMKKSWRRNFLEALAQAQVPVDKYWLLTRVDLVEEEDLRLYAQANCGLGFGLESGDPGLLAIIRKSGKLKSYLDRMKSLARSATTYQVPWGANIICGHPGETPDSLRRSARYMRELFLESGGSTGFLSIDPFRLYPGSPIDAERHHYETRYGTRFHRPEWWQDGDQEFLSEWTDPSSELNFLEREALQHELFEGIAQDMEANFVYQGSARPYFLRAIRSQLQLFSEPKRMATFERYYAWQKYVGKAAEARQTQRQHLALRACSKRLRRQELPKVVQRAQLKADSPIARLLEETPREQHAPLDALDVGHLDRALALSHDGASTISALHAYAISLDLLTPKPGDVLLDLGAGNGYGTRLLAALVGPQGSVYSLEWDGTLVREAASLLDADNIHPREGDALSLGDWPVAPHRLDGIHIGFALPAIPPSWARVLKPGTVLVCPLGSGATQRMTRAVLGPDRRWKASSSVQVRYVPARGPQALHL